MTDIMAGMGLAQIKRYPQLVARRHEIIKIYEDALKGHQVKTLNHEDEKTNSKSSGHLFITRVEGIDEKTRNEKYLEYLDMLIRLILKHTVHSDYMCFRQVYDIDIVTDARTVCCIIIIAEYA